MRRGSERIVCTMECLLQQLMGNSGITVMAVEVTGLECECIYEAVIVDRSNQNRRMLRL